jgi:MFS family permease
MALGGTTVAIIPRSSQRAAIYTLSVLVILYVVSLIDRQILAMLIGDIKHSLGLGDFQVSLLMGTAFGVFYVLFGAPFGWLSDRYPRGLVIFWGMVLWSLACGFGGLVHTFPLLFASRMMVGAGEAALGPAAYSLMADLFDRERLPTAMAIYHFGGSAGGAIALLVGGLVAQAANDVGPLSMPLVGSVSPWQLALLIVAVPGILIAFLALTLPEPHRPFSGQVLGDVPLAGFGDFVRTNRGLLVCHFLAFALALVVVYANASWTPEHLRRAFHWSPAKIGSTLAVLALLGPLTGQIVGVKLIALLNRAHHKDATLRGFLLFVAIALPCEIFAFTTTSPTACLAAVFFLYACLSPLMTFGASALQLFTPVAYRGRLSGAFLGFVSLSGLGVGPALVGWLVQYHFHDAADLGLSLTIVGGASLALAATFLMLGLHPLRRAILMAESASAIAPRAAGEAPSTPALAGS